MNKNQEIKELAGLFLKLGITAFGGPAAHIAMMQQEVVSKRKWMSEQAFLDLLGATNLIPGPNSTEMAIHIGKERAGWKGLLVAGFFFIMPSVLITGFFAWLYKEYGQLPQIQPFIYGIKPAIIAIILAAIYPLAKKSLKSKELGLIGLAAVLFSLFNFNEVYILFGSGLVALFLAFVKNRDSRHAANFFPITLLQISGTAISASNLNLFLIFLKIGAILYGSGYVLFAFLDTELVARGLLSRQVLIDAIAVGQFTPGPVFSSVTFIGYQMKGISGALVSTLGIFLPAFVFVALLNPLVKRMRNSTLSAAFLDAVNVASVAVILVVCYEMGKESLPNWKAICVALMSMAVLIKFNKLNSAWIVLGASGLGYLLWIV